MRIVVIHGPNLNLLGRREPEIYGHATLDQIDRVLVDQARELGVDVTTFQSNHEGAIVDRIQAMVLLSPGADGLLINPAALTHTSIAVRDAIAAVDLPAWEVHLSDPRKREAFRHTSLIEDVCVGRTVGLGPEGYTVALEGLVRHLRQTEEA